MFVENRGSDGTGRRRAVLVEAANRRSAAPTATSPDLDAVSSVNLPRLYAEVQPRHFLCFHVALLQFRQLSDIGRDAPRLVSREQLRS